MYAFNSTTGKISWKFQAIDADSGTNAQVRAVSKDGGTAHFSAGRALYALDAATGKLKWAVQTKQVMYTSPAIAPDGTVVYGASRGGVARAISVEGRELWNASLGVFASTMGAITDDGKHVLLVSKTGLAKVEIATGNVVWNSARGGNVQSAAIVIDAASVVWATTGHGVDMTDGTGNTTNCDIRADIHDGSGFSSIGAATLAADGVILQLSIHGMLKALTAG